MTRVALLINLFYYFIKLNLLIYFNKFIKFILTFIRNRFSIFLWLDIFLWYPRRVFHPSKNIWAHNLITESEAMKACNSHISMFSLLHLITDAIVYSLSWLMLILKFNAIKGLEPSPPKHKSNCQSTTIHKVGHIMENQHQSSVTIFHWIKCLLIKSSQISSACLYIEGRDSSTPQLLS